MNKLLNRIRKNISTPVAEVEHGKMSFSQCGEDLIANFIFEQIRIEYPTFLDLGAHHPKYLSNTYFFYKRGCRGLNVEPDPFLISEFLKVRPEDKNLCVGVGLGDQRELADFFVMSSRTLNTFSRDEATRIEKFGTHKIEQVLQVEIVPINDIIRENFLGAKPNFVSIDVEGLDFEILQRMNLTVGRPEVFCVETLTYSEDNTEKKAQAVTEFMRTQNYLIYADTFINTIFVDADTWKNR